jgi:predicted phage terminase large subunit-like protein
VTDLLDRQLAAFNRGAGIPDPGRARWDGPLDILCAIDHRSRRTRALELVSGAVAWAERTPDARLIIVLAPQQGKSSTATRAGALYLLGRDPRRRVIIASYADRIARRWGRRIRNDITENSGNGRLDLGLRLAPDQKAADEWELVQGGGIFTCGVGGALTSRSAEAMIIDDPLKGRKDADSDIVREDVWEWWESTASSRLAPGAPVILILTRWHHDDLAGRLLKAQPGGWRVVHIPAQADPDIVDPDPLGRAAGEFMEAAVPRTREQWEERKRDAGDEWVPLHQGYPQAPGGKRFDVDKLRYWHLSRDGSEVVCGPRSWRIRDCYRFVTVDTATTKTTRSDYTVASAWAVTLDAHLVLLDVARDRTTEDEQIGLARPLVERWAPECTWIEPSLKSTLLVRQAVAEGWVLNDLKPDTDKLVRAAPAARRVKDGRVWFPAEHPLLDTIVKELREFPDGRHDDFVDTFAYAVLVQHEQHVPAGADMGARQVRPGVDPLASAFPVPGAVDYGRQQW